MGAGLLQEAEAEVEVRSRVEGEEEEVPWMQVEEEVEEVVYHHMGVVEGAEEEEVVQCPLLEVVEEWHRLLQVLLQPAKGLQRVRDKKRASYETSVSQTFTSTTPVQPLYPKAQAFITITCFIPSELVGETRAKESGGKKTQCLQKLTFKF